MSFIGTTPPEVKLLLQELMKGVEKKNVFIGCSGNYTTDKVMAGMGYNVHSNDVSLYSKLISDLLLGADTDVEVINPELRNIFNTWKETKYKKLAQVMFAVRVSGFHQRKNSYQEEMFNAFIEHSKIYYHNTIEKLEKGALNFQINSFFYGDFIDFLKRKKGKGVGISFPPTYKGGYEKLFNYIEEGFAYEHAPYNIFDPKGGGAILGNLLRMDTSSINDGDIELTEMKFLFVESRNNDVKNVLRHLEKLKLEENTGIVVGLFEAFIKVVTEVKKAYSIKRNTVAFAYMVDICSEHLKKVKKEV